jgi:hypothetical protein
METDVILELIDIAISIAHNQFSGTDLKYALLDIVDRAVEAYNEHTGAALDADLITAEEAL